MQPSRVGLSFLLLLLGAQSCQSVIKNLDPDGTGHLTIGGGEREFEGPVSSYLDEHDAFTFGIDWTQPEASLGLEAHIVPSAVVEDVTGPGGTIEAGFAANEFSAGLFKELPLASGRVSLLGGVGGSLMHVDMTDWDGSTVAEKDGLVLGAYAHVGVALHLTDHFSIGADYRRTFAPEFGLGSSDVDVSYDLLGLFVRIGF